jgi:hypothetical protein
MRLFFLACNMDSHLPLGLQRKIAYEIRLQEVVEQFLDVGVPDEFRPEIVQLAESIDYHGLIIAILQLEQKIDSENFDAPREHIIAALLSLAIQHEQPLVWGNFFPKRKDLNLSLALMPLYYVKESISLTQRNNYKNRLSDPKCDVNSLIAWLQRNF